MSPLYALSCILFSHLWIPNHHQRFGALAVIFLSTYFHFMCIQLRFKKISNNHDTSRSLVQINPPPRYRPFSLLSLFVFGGHTTATTTKKRESSLFSDYIYLATSKLLITTATSFVISTYFLSLVEKFTDSDVFW